MPDVIELKQGNAPTEEGLYFTFMSPEMGKPELVKVFRGLECWGIPRSENSKKLFFQIPIPGGFGAFEVKKADFWSNRLEVVCVN